MDRRQALQLLLISRTAIKTLAKGQPIAHALGSMSDNASDSASSSVSTVCDLSVRSEVADH